MKRLLPILTAIAGIASLVPTSRAEESPVLITTEFEFSTPELRSSIVFKPEQDYSWATGSTFVYTTMEKDGVSLTLEVPGKVAFTLSRPDNLTPGLSFKKDAAMTVTIPDGYFKDIYVACDDATSTNFYNNKDRVYIATSTGTFNNRRTRWIQDSDNTTSQSVRWDFSGVLNQSPLHFSKISVAYFSRLSHTPPIQATTDDGFEPEYYNLQGIRVAPHATGILIEKTGSASRIVRR